MKKVIHPPNCIVPIFNYFQCALIAYIVCIFVYGGPNYAIFTCFIYYSQNLDGVLIS